MTRHKKIINSQLKRPHYNSEQGAYRNVTKYSLHIERELSFFPHHRLRITSCGVDRHQEKGKIEYYHLMK